MRIAYFSPLPPSKSGIADYSAELLPYLARGAEISVFVEHAREVRANQGQPYRVYDVAHFDEIQSRQPFDVCFYHQGNNPYHDFIYDRAVMTPGIAVLHEHCLHHLMAWRTLERQDSEAYWELMFQTYGRRGARLAEMRERGLGSEYQQFLLPLNHQLVTRSLGVITHNAYAAANLEWWGAEAAGENAEGAGKLLGAPPLVEVIPHHLSPKVYELDGWDAADCRRELRLPEDRWIVAAFGYVTLVKRVPVLLAAFKRLLQVVPQALCLLVGEDQSEVSGLIGEMGLERDVVLTGYTGEAQFFRYLKAVDAVVNLRFPTAGETSGTLIRAFGAGKPVIVSDHAQFAELPDEVCLKVPIGENEEDVLYRQLRRLASQPALQAGLGRRAAKWARAECEISRSAARYLNLAERVVATRGALGALRDASHSGAARRAASPAETPLIECDSDEAMTYALGFFSDNPEAQGYLNHHRERLLETLKLIPRGQATHRLLELSSYLQMPPLIRRYGQYGEIAITGYWHGEPAAKPQRIVNPAGEVLDFRMKRLDVERERFPYPDEYFDVALCCEIIEHLAEDPMHMLVELNRVLKWGGQLIVTTPNISSAISIQAALTGASPYVYGNYNRKSPADRHHREFTPEDLRVAFESAGFKVERLYTQDTWNRPDPKVLEWLDRTGVARELRGDNIFAVGRKASTRIERYPAQLYD